MTNAWQPRAALNRGASVPYIPHPAPNSAGNEDTPTTTSNMGSTWSLLKVIDKLHYLGILPQLT